MNVRKNIDYSQMYQAIDEVMVQKMPQMQLYSAIGKIVCSRSEKGAAVMASEYVRTTYLDVQGFSPRNLRRMRDFYRTYENHPVLLSLAMQLGWTQNVVIMEADLTMKLREWYLRATRQFGWSKAELMIKIEEQAYLDVTIKFDGEMELFCFDLYDVTASDSVVRIETLCMHRRIILRTVVNRCRGSPHKGNWCTTIPTDGVIWG